MNLDTFSSKINTRYAVLMLILFVFLINKAQSQDKWQLGLKVLPQIANVADKAELDEVKLAIGGGVFFCRKLNKMVALQSGIFYSNRGYRQGSVSFKYAFSNVEEEKRYITYKFSYLEIPVLLKIYKSNFYFLIGPSFNWLTRTTVKGEDFKKKFKYPDFYEDVAFGGEAALGYEKKVFNHYAAAFEVNLSVIPSELTKKSPSKTFINYGFGLSFSYLFE